MESLLKLLAILLQGRPLSLAPCVYRIINLYQYELMDIDFIIGL